MIKKNVNKKASDEIFEIRQNANAEYEAKIRDLEKKSVEALKRLEAHMRSRELELKDKQEAELTQMKKSLMDVMKEKESGIWKNEKKSTHRKNDYRTLIYILYILFMSIQRKLQCATYCM